MAVPPVAPSLEPEPERRPRVRVLWKWSLAALAAFIAFGAYQCGTALYQGRGLSGAAVRHFHQQLNAAQFEAICNEAGEGFSAPEKRDELTKLLSAVHRKLGDAGDSSLFNIRVNVEPGGTFLTADYNTSFARGPATETFTWKKNGTTLKLYGYNIQSNALIVD
jgi:hypothetical protein